MRVVEVPTKKKTLPTTPQSAATTKRPVVDPAIRNDYNESGYEKNDTVPNEVLADGAASFERRAASKGQAESSNVVVTDQLKIFTLLLQVYVTLCSYLVFFVKKILIKSVPKNMFELCFPSNLLFLYLMRINFFQNYCTNRLYFFMRAIIS